MRRGRIALRTRRQRIAVSGIVVPAVPLCLLTG
jgi:hypothetical protein